MSNTSARSGGRNQRNNPYVLDELFVSFHRSPAGTAWRWRTELTTLTMTLAALWRLALLITLLWAAVALAGLVLVLAFVPVTAPVHHPAVLVRPGPPPPPAAVLRSPPAHPLRRLPLILWTRPTKVGERIHLLCRAGICAEDFEAHIGELRAACYARDARVTRNRRWSQLVTIDVIRRDTLAASELIKSPLQRLTERYQLELVPSQDSPDEREPAA